jgi:hypothetical protein
MKAKLIFYYAITVLIGGLAACSGGSSDYSASDNCSRGATPTGLSAIIKSVTTDPSLPNLSLCIFNALYTNDFPTAYADNPQLAKGAAPYVYYSYGNLAQAYQELFVDLDLYTAPFNSGDEFQDKRELAAFFANINQETNGASPPSFKLTGDFTTTGAGTLGAAYGLAAITEGSCATSGCPAYGTKQGFCENTDTTAQLSACNGIPTTPDGTDYCSLAVRFCDGVYPANSPAYQFFGRGSKQLTHAYNYIFYGSRIAPDDPLNLANNPSLIDTSGVLGWKVGFAYWAIPFQEPSGNLKPSMHDGFFNPTTGSASAQFDAQTGFGKTVNIINGGVECGASRTFIRNTTLNRINSYIELLLRLNPSIPINRVEVTQGSGAVDVYTLVDLQQNIETQNPLNENYDPTLATASQLVKHYNTNGLPKTSNYRTVEPGWTMQGPGNGRYNSAPLLQEYHFASDSPPSYNNGQTNLKKIMLYYDTNSAGLTEERLDCAGVADYSGN